jgi:hypothetical protein
VAFDDPLRPPMIEIPEGFLPPFMNELPSGQEKADRR